MLKLSVKYFFLPICELNKSRSRRIRYKLSGFFSLKCWSHWFPMLSLVTWRVLMLTRNTKKSLGNLSYHETSRSKSMSVCLCINWWMSRCRVSFLTHCNLRKLVIKFRITFWASDLGSHVLSTSDIFFSGDLTIVLF